jgi:hypothetical protein
MLKIDPELLRQVFGFWLEPGESVPSWPPRYEGRIVRPTGAVLPPLDVPVLDVSEVICLDLITMENYWLPLSKQSLYTYKHSWCLLNGEVWRFIPIKEAVGSWPVVYEVFLASPVSSDEIGAIYGEDVASRAPQRPIVQLRLMRSCSSTASSSSRRDPRR